MKLYRNDEKNKNERTDNLFLRIYHYIVFLGLAATFALIPYFLVVSCFRYSKNYLNINYMFMRFFVKVGYVINVFFLVKTIHKNFNTSDLPNGGYFMLFNHVNELEFPFDFYFARGSTLYDTNAMKKMSVIYPAVSTFGIPIHQGREIKKSIGMIDKYLKVTNILVYPEGERGFSNSPMEYKKGILKLIYDQKYKTIVFYKGGMEKLDRNLYYYKSEVIDPISFNNFKDFYSHLIQVTADYHKDFLEKIK